MSGGGEEPLGRDCASPVDVVAHARDESGQEEERLPVRRFSARHTTHIAVGATVALGGQSDRIYT